jgi:hypothetical protein
MLSRTIAGWIMVLFVGAVSLIVLWKIFNNTIDLKKLISEANGDASMSRFQFLIFTFVIALMWIYIFFNNGCNAFPIIPTGVLELIGISGGTYVVSKGIQKSFESDQAKADAGVSSTAATQAAAAQVAATQAQATQAAAQAAVHAATAQVAAAQAVSAAQLGQ